MRRRVGKQNPVDVESVSRDIKTRIDYLDSLKGFAIILVVLGHVCLGYNAARTYPSATGALAAIHKAIYMFHMPLFMTISGYVFHAGYLTDDGGVQRGRIFQQTLNLLLTCFLFSAMLGVLKMSAVGYTNSVTSWRDIQLIPVRPISPYWYLYVLATFYTAFAAGGAFLCRMHPAILLPALASLSVLGCFVDADTWFELRRSLYYSFPFGLGIMLHRSAKWIPVNAITTPLFGVGAVALAAAFWHDGRQIDAIPVVNLAVGVSFTLFFWGAFSQIRILARNQALRLVGRFSLEIYVLHCIFTAGHRAVLPRLGVTNAFTGTMANLIVSVLIPMLIGVVCRSVGVHGLIFRPISYLCHKTINRQLGR